MWIKWKEISSKIDHTILKPTATLQDVLKTCREAVSLGTYSVVVPPCWIRHARREFKELRIVSVVGFPHGYSSPSAKKFEAEDLIDGGVDEIDSVINLSFLKSNLWDLFDQDVIGVVEVAKSRGIVTKAIIETARLTEEEKVRATERLANLGVDFVKTSTGFVERGATVEDVRLLKSVARGRIKVKAAGGIRLLDDVIRMLEAGADRIGTSSTLGIYKEHERSLLLNSS